MLIGTALAKEESMNAPSPAGDPGITITARGVPAPQGSKKAFARGKKIALVEANAGLKPWRRALTLQARKHAGAYAGKHAIAVEYDFYLPRQPTVRRLLPWVKPDLDKLIRAANDALSDARIWDDDGRVTYMLARKHYENESTPPGVTITIRKAYA